MPSLSVEPVILLHGLWLRRPALWPLAQRLRAAGFAPRSFAYATLWAAPEQSVQRLAGLMRSLGPGPVHVIGHSLGGLTALAAMQSAVDLPPGRVVCLGSPLAGSAVARRMRSRGLSYLVGRSGQLLEQGVEIPKGREVGVIAGSRRFGLGQWLAPGDAAGDGTVAVSETRRTGLRDHTCLPVSHSGMLFSAEVAQACVAFLRSGTFSPH